VSDVDGAPLPAYRYHPGRDGRAEYGEGAPRFGVVREPGTFGAMVSVRRVPYSENGGAVCAHM